MYFNYHAKVKKKIAQVGVEKFEFVKNTTIFRPHFSYISKMAA